MQKAFRISLFFFSLILTIFALINLIMPNIHLNELNLMNDHTMINIFKLSTYLNKTVMIIS